MVLGLIKYTGYPVREEERMKGQDGGQMKFSGMQK